MKIIIVKDYDEMSKVGADLIAEVINKKPEAILGLATGSSPEGLYSELIKKNKNNEIDFSNITTVNLDEYVGLSGEHPQSYRCFMNDKLFNHINIDKERTFVPNGLAKDIEEECNNYDKKIEELGGIDIQLLGIGNNGHIAFNEPAKELSYGTHLTGLTESTIKANSRFFASMDEVPKTALTMGIGSIMRAKKIVLIASGESKGEAIAQLVSGKITTEVPATMLQVHPDVTLVVDEAAAKLIK
ncbi:glucosamine-6-phosphate deaminase [Clostridium amylolyticum]|uniref:Glucosamine-6-phosphate deaminase n=1 Tax=Clostridium amylolyticum TaxID=1121298 RepID=A0A1M6JWR6_9CLOT|nr:glucosamine-6-phosphate deaminase [Clostridium amylolyticum]SHJ51165.1 glucosamine-6-phosphate deaminase [Clostridium amylolyticum]